MNNESSEVICHDNFNILCRVNAIMRDIICLKNENRSIRQRIKHLNKLNQLNVKEIRKVVKVATILYIKNTRKERFQL